MQRRATSTTKPKGSSPSSPTNTRPRLAAATTAAARTSRPLAQNPITWLIVAAVLLLVASLYFFPSQLEFVEQAAQAEAEQMAHRAEAYYLQASSSSNNNKLDRTASELATQRMLAQSSKWVDGEKALKRQLVQLQALQAKGEHLGVPVLTRYLGDDFPAWVTPDMDEAEWRANVKAKYEQMAKEEEEWKMEMKVLIEQREKELGISTGAI